MKYVLLISLFISSFLFAEGNPFLDGYYQRDNPFLDGYVQDSNPFADGYIQDTNPFLDGYEIVFDQPVVEAFFGSVFF